MEIQEILAQAVEKDASDVFLVAGLPVTLKQEGRQLRLGEGVLMPERTQALIGQIYQLSGREQTRLAKGADDDFSFAMRGLGRLPASKATGILRFSVESPPALPVSVPAGTVCMTADERNQSRDCHIITMEDPIEYVYRHEKAIVTQREISIDTPGYTAALRSALRESPDVILLGEMRDYDTISAAITATETGLLLFSTLHTSSAANTITRIIDVFPANQQHQVKIQLSQLLKGVVCQQLVPGTDGTLLPVFEIMKTNNAIQNMIREDKLHQLDSVMMSGAEEGMCTMDGSLLKLFRQGKITKETALVYCVNYDVMAKRLAAR